MLSTKPVDQSNLSSTLSVALAAPHSGRPADSRHVESFVQYLTACAIPWKGTRCERSGSLTGAAFALLPPGRTAILIFPAPGHFGIQPDDQLVAMSELMSRLEPLDLHYAQALVEPDDVAKSKLLDRLGFWHLASLNYKQRDPNYPWVDPPPAEAVNWVAYGPKTQAEFAATIEATYENSGDCPKLNGLRPIEDVMASHRAAGQFDPALWQLARVDGRGVACLLLSRLTHGSLMELVYMGVVPASRNRRLGALLIQRALDLCRRARVGKLTLVVDASNESASRLYRRFDFQQIAARDAYLHQWSGNSAGE